MILVYLVNRLVGDRASTTNHRWRNLFPFGIVLGSLDPTINDRYLKFRYKKTAF